MKSSNITYKTKTATYQSIFDHLSQCDTVFDPPLHTYVNIEEYSKKIFDFATTIEAWSNNRLIGLIACYLNNHVTLEGHITNVSIIKEYHKQGIAFKLMDITIQESLKSGFLRLTIEVEAKNRAAITLYQNSGFVISGSIGSKYSMVNNIK